MTAGWQVRRLDELGFVGRGRSRHRPRNDPSLYGGPYPFVQTADIKAANLRLRDFTQTYNDNGLAQSKLWSPGTLCITIAANIAETAILGISACFPDSVIGFLSDPTKSDPFFIKYCFDFMKLRMQQVSHGTTQDNLSLDKLLTFDFVVPEAPTQRKIAAILSAYDNLIDNNIRRIKILEEMAQTIYREWFVKFRFPGYKKFKMVESSLGKLPEGWEVTTVGRVTSYISRGITPKYDVASDSIVINQKCIRRHMLDLSLARRHNTRVVPEKCVQFGDILINSTGIGTLGRVAQVYTALSDTTVDTHISIVRPRDSGAMDYIGMTLMNMESHFDSLGAGATGQTELHRDRISETEIVFPAVDLQREFSSMVAPVRRLVVILTEKNSALRQTRDLLLPRLVSGDLDVSDLDIAITEADP